MGVAEAEDPPVGRHLPVPAAVWRRRHAHDRGVERLAAHGAVEAGAAVVEDAAVRGHHPVAGAAVRRRHAHHGLVQAAPARRAREGGVAVAEDAAVGAHEVVAVARHPPQQHVLGPVGPGHRHRRGVDADGRGREVHRDVAGLPGRQVAVRRAQENTPCPPVWTAVMSMPSPEAHSSMFVVCVVPGRTEAFTPKGNTPTGSNGASWAQVKYGRVHGVTPYEELGRRGAVPHPHEDGRRVGAEDDVPVAPAPAPARRRAVDVGPARPVVVHPQRQGAPQRPRGGVGGGPLAPVGREGRVGVGVGAGLGVGVEVGGEPRDGGEAAVDPLQVGQDEELLGRRQGGPVAGQAHGASPSAWRSP